MTKESNKDDDNKNLTDPIKFSTTYKQVLKILKNHENDRENTWLYLSEWLLTSADEIKEGKYLLSQEVGLTITVSNADWLATMFVMPDESGLDMEELFCEFANDLINTFLRDI